MMTTIKKIRGFTRTAGFTLIETLVAILILTVAITGPLTIASRGLNAALIAKDQTIAFYLAQDAVEFVRATRDSNRMKSADWLSGIPIFPATTPGIDIETPCSGSGCTIDVFATTPLVSASTCGTGCKMYYNSTNHQYTQTAAGATVTPFTRKLVVTKQNTQGSSDEEVTLIVTVTWNDVSTQQHSVSVREDLFNWQ